MGTNHIEIGDIVQLEIPSTRLNAHPYAKVVEIDSADGVTLVRTDYSLSADMNKWYKIERLKLAYTK